MFSNIGWAEVLVLVFAALFVLGPERLPGAAAWAGRTIRQVREYATGARDQLQEELGADFDQLRKPLNDLQQLRGLNPKTMITKHLFDGESPSLFGPEATAGATAAGAVGAVAAPGKPKTADPVNMVKPLAADERPPFDPDAT